MQEFSLTSIISAGHAHHVKTVKIEKVGPYYSQLGHNWHDLLY